MVTAETPAASEEVCAAAKAATVITAAEAATEAAGILFLPREAARVTVATHTAELPVNTVRPVKA